MESGTGGSTVDIRGGAAERDTRELDAGDLIGQRIGGYEIRERIGAGGMGAVYLGVHPTLGRKVAVKVILAEHAGNEELRRRFFEEGRLAASIEHPHVVAIHDLAQLPDGRCYLVMEHLEGESLSQRLRRTERMEPPVAAAIVGQALAGLSALHAKHLVHRDVKPSNLFLVRTDAGEQVKLLDFGIAKLRGDGGAGLTRTGAVIGTPGYMAPEQTAEGGEVDGRADLYSLAVILYEMLAGRPPFEADDWVELLYMHRRSDPPPLSGVDAALAEVVMRGLAKQPGDRFATADDMRFALGEAVGGIGELPAPRPARRGRWHVAALVGAVAIAAGGAGAWLAGRGDDAQPVAAIAADAAPVAPAADASAIAVEAPPDAAPKVIAVVTPDAAPRRVRHTKPRPKPDAGAGATATTTVKSKTYFTTDGVPTTHFDIDKGIGRARKLARQLIPDVKLVMIRAYAVGSDGTADLTGTGYVSYTFRSPSLSEGVKTGAQARCLVSVHIRGARTQVQSTYSSCREPFITKRCTAKQLWDAAIAAGSSPDQVGSMSYNQVVDKWQLRLEEGYTRVPADDCD